MFSILLICGGPSPERGISLNSARSVLDHLEDFCKISVIYINQKLQFYPISCDQLYSNTPEDFDFKLSDNHLEGDYLKEFFRKFDLIFPLVHGKFGEDGTLQSLLEKWNIPFLGSSSVTCQNAFNKSKFNQFLRNNGFNYLEMFSIKKGDNLDYPFINKRIIKPASCGSSFGVTIVENQNEFNIAVNKIFDTDLDDQIVVEEFLQGSEFTLVILENFDGEPVPLIPTEVEILSDGIFDYRKKYLPSNTTRNYCPPRFPDNIIESIRAQAKEIFQLLQLKHLVRIDGWFLDDGRILFTDLNIMSGMEQNSFLFQQAAWVGLTHSELLLYLIRIACKQYNLELSLPTTIDNNNKEKVYVIFGGNSSEKEVSIMSGTNVWLKLLNSNLYHPQTFLLDQKNCWSLPYPYNLYHTVEEIIEACNASTAINQRINQFSKEISLALNIEHKTIEEPKLYNLESLLHQAKNQNAFIFLALHGGFGEDGSIQSLLEKLNIPFNGSGSKTSKLCIDKYKTGELLTYNQNLIKLEKIPVKLHNGQFISRDGQIINYILLVDLLKIKKFIIKPMRDGCSTGIITMQSQEDLDSYLDCINNLGREENNYFISKNNSIIQLPDNPTEQEYLIEPFIEVDIIKIENQQLQILDKGGWIEMTIGVLTNHNKFYALIPSITLAKDNILSLEEKFQGGTGINLIPPPAELLDLRQIALIKQEIENTAKLLKINNYARFDIFFNRKSDNLIIIEINSLPALTPSTVLFHQALVESPPIKPKKFLEKIISKVFFK
jgi:D-alanine--D-alanine ligase